ncbi:MAG: hypothetical protein GY828_07635 [Candidatus Gracilibacteria bacterium]|nr:hypothetical protein [Candidatus Gracilibacteria bacterium]
MIKIDKKTLLEFQDKQVKKIHVFFYEAGCSGMKVDIEFDFNETELELVAIFPDLDGEGVPIHNPPLQGEGIKVYIEGKNKEQFDGATITKIRTQSDNPHLKGKKERYIFSNPKIQDRCGCGTSFSFDRKKPKINLKNLQLLKKTFRK